MEDDPNPISDVPSYTIRTAAYVGDYETLKWFLRRHKKYLDEYLESDNVFFDDGDDAEYKHVDEMDFRSDPNAKDANLRTSLHIACLFNHVEITKVLLNEPLNSLYSRDINEQLPIHLATPACLKEIIQYFKEQEVKFEAQNKMEAERKDQDTNIEDELDKEVITENMQSLCKMVEMKDKHGRSVIMNFCYFNKYEEVEIILNEFPYYVASAYLNRKDSYGLSPMALSIVGENIKCTEK